MLAAGSLPAQELTASVSGAVLDSSGAVIPDAAVTMLNAATRVLAWQGRTNGSGRYSAPALPVGRYEISVEAKGFKKSQISGVELRVDQRARVDVTLQPGELVETVTVTGEGLGQIDLPMPARNVLNLLTLVGGVSSGGAATGINASQLSINGSRTLSSEFSVDGVSVVSGSTGGVQRVPSTEAVREFRVLTSGYTAEFGRTSGGYVNLVIDSGSNDFHGTLYEYFRNEDLNANNFFRNLRCQPRQPDRFNQFGGKVGGPVWISKLYNGRERAFFFFNYEGLRTPFNNISTVPTQDYRSGDFSASPVPVFDALSGAQFPGNRIPASRIDPAAAKILRGFTISPILIARDGLPDTITQTNLYPDIIQQRPNTAGGNPGAFAPSMTAEGTSIRYLLAPTDPNFPLRPSGPLFTGSRNARWSYRPRLGRWAATPRASLVSSTSTWL